MIALPTLAEAGVWASIISASAAAIALSLNAKMLAVQQRSNDALTLFKVFSDIREGEDRLLAATADAKAFAIASNHYLNMLEAFAATVNQKLIGPKSREIATDRLITDLGMFLAQEAMTDRIGSAITSDDTFSELRAFRRRHNFKVNRAFQRWQSLSTTGFEGVSDQS